MLMLHNNFKGSNKPFLLGELSKLNSSSLVFNLMSIQLLVVEMFPEAKLLSSGFQGSVYELSENTVVKAISEGLFWETFEGGFEPVDKLAMEWANNVNDLVIKYKNHFEVPELGHLVASERVYPCVVTAFSREQIEKAIEVAEAQLEELWASGFAHCDLKRPDVAKKIEGCCSDDVLFNNIVLTRGEGNTCVIRLIDLGTANLEQYDEDDEIEEHVDKDRADWEEYKLWILNYPRKA